MSRKTNERVMMRYKTNTANLLTILGLLVEHVTSLAKPKASIEAYIAIRKTYYIVTSIKPVIYPSVSRLFSFRSMLI